jgi:hypothetical protein
MDFCSPELRALLKLARGLDWHAIAARLDSGLYQATGTQLIHLHSNCITECMLLPGTKLEGMAAYVTLGFRIKARPGI